MSVTDAVALARPAFAAVPARRPRIALVLDPRFPGGTSTAVAAEIRALAPRAELQVVALRTAMFRNRPVHPLLADAVEEAGLALDWNPAVVRADTIVVHNPSFLRHDGRLGVRLACRHAFVILHENPLRPDPLRPGDGFGGEGYDFAACLGLLDRALVAGERRLVPVSASSRASGAAWLDRSGADWRLADFDWPAILDLPRLPPTPAPRDRRGRVSRPGFEKFPDRATMLAHFPPTAEACTLLGGDLFLDDPDGPPPHWTIHRFGAIPVAEALAAMDFFVYFTNPAWRESLGRVIGEAIAAGKLVITDAATASSFPGAAIASDGEDVDRIVAEHVRHPARYVAAVEAAQLRLKRFAPAAAADAILARAAEGAR